jgi:hypothetical protein
MKYLEKLEYSDSEINETLKCISPDILELLENNHLLVEANLLFLKELGISNYKQIFSKYYDMFLLDNNTFSSIFNKYDPSDLKIKLNNNLNIIEIL